LHTLHFVLNNVMKSDNRIPPYGFTYDEAKVRNCLPVPTAQFGNPGPGGTFNYWDERPFLIPQGAVSAQIRLYYQQTSWEYIQFLWKQNDGLNTFLKDEGKNLLDAWLNTGQAAPLQISLTTVSGLVPTVRNAPGEASHQNVRAEHISVAYDRPTGRMDVLYTPACDTTGHTIYYGDLASVGSYDWAGADCLTDISGFMSFTPTQPNVFFVVVGNNGVLEGSYGKNSSGAQRAEAGAINGCDFPMDLGGTCDAP
jgi:hypothetical protein